MNDQRRSSARARSAPRRRWPVAGWLAGLALVAVVLAGAAVVFTQRSVTAPPTALSTAPPVVDPSAPGGLAATNPVVDLGRVPFNRQVDATYELVNTGGTPVRLTAAPTVAMLEGC